jgi:hypothetical protein
MVSRPQPAGAEFVGVHSSGGRRPRPLTLVGNFVEHLAGKVKHLLGIANEAVE